MHVGRGSLAYSFCPGKATWSLEASELFETCRLTLETGIMPRGPSLDDQDELFMAVLPAYVERWRARNYQKIWDDVSDFTNSVLKSVFPNKT